MIELAKGPETAQVAVVAEVEGGSAGSEAEGGPSAVLAGQPSILKPLARASVLANEAFSGFRDGKWEYHGDAVDVALLMMALEGGITQQGEENNYPRIAQIPFESKHQFSATLHGGPDGKIAFVKGSPEKILKMSSKMATSEGEIPLDPPGGE